MGESALTIFCRQVRKRSRDNRQALELLHHSSLTGNVVAVLRQELDSMVRCIFLLSIHDRRYRNLLIEDAVQGRPWRSKDGKRKVTDRDMVDLSTKLHGWAQNVYAFGCSFIHLSAFHDHTDRDPLVLLTPEDRKNVADYLKSYHGITVDSTTAFSDITPLLPAVFDKIAGTLECYVKDLEADLELTP